MAGVGIAAAIGFVFALTILNSNAGTDSPEVAQRVAETQPDADSSFLFAQQAPADEGAPAGESAAMLKQDDPAGSSPQQEMFLTQDATELRPTLSSVIAVDGTTGEVIAEVTEGSQFVIGKPVFIQAQFANPNETAVLDHTLVMTLARNGTEDDTLLEQAANFRGDIGANENVNLEFYWNPDAEGEHLLRVFSLTPGDLAQGNPEPILSIPIQAVSG
jgi:hypothetical protein